jgi:hypothetical protein
LYAEFRERDLGEMPIHWQKRIVVGSSFFGGADGGV